MTSRVHVGFTVGLLIVCLRLAVGWHFFTAGTEKLNNPGFRASYFLDQAVGPFASFYHGLDEDPFSTAILDLDAQRQAANAIKDAASQHAGDDEDSQAGITSAYAKFTGRIDDFEDAYGEDLHQHIIEVARYQSASDDANWTGVDFGRAWLKSKRAELKRDAAGWRSDIREFQSSLRADLAAIVGDEHLPPAAPDRWAEKGWLEQSVTWTTLLVGAGLMLGLFTRLSALVGAGFLVSVMLTQPFWVSSANLDYAPYQLVELVVLLFLAAIGAGRFAGLDGLLFGRRSSD